MYGQKYSKNDNIVKCYFNLIYLVIYFCDAKLNLLNLYNV